MPTTTQRPIDTWERFLRAHKKVTEQLASELAAERDLKIPWYDVLVQLHDAGGRLRMSELAEQVLFSTSGLTRLLDRMTKDGLVERHPCENDRRGFWAVLTEAGRKSLTRARRTHVRGIHRHFLDPLEDSDLKALDSAMRRLIETDTSR